MQHLTEEQLVAHYYRDADAHDHLRSCAECAAQYETIRRVLALVTEAPVPEKSASYGEEVWTRLRWRLGAQRRTNRWVTITTAAAMLAVAFFAGHFWREKSQPVPTMATATASGAAPAGAPARVFLVVLGDHLSTSERVLTEIANADPNAPPVLEERASELVAANRIYRQAAGSTGDDHVAALLADLEPILMEISRASTADEVTQLQKRIESRGLLFKVRVLNAQVSATDSL